LESVVHILIAIAVLAALSIYLVFRSKGSNKVPRIDQTPKSPYERVIGSIDFQALVIENSHRIPVLVDFYAHWCAPCHAFSPILSDMAKSCDGSFLLAKVDFDQNKELAVAHGVKALPAIALFRDGERVDGFSGGKPPHSLKFFLAKNGVDVPEDA
jgi:thioredoxin